MWLHLDDTAKTLFTNKKTSFVYISSKCVAVERVSATRNYLSSGAQPGLLIIDPYHQHTAMPDVHVQHAGKP